MSQSLQEFKKDLFESANQSDYLLNYRKGLDEDLVRMISEEKQEPQWMREKRLAGLAEWNRRPLPQWGPDLNGLNFDEITYYAKATDKPSETWEDVPADIKETFDRLGIPQMEQKIFAGVGAQYESAVVYHSLQKELQEQGVIFEDMDVALRDHEAMVKEYFMTRCVPIHDHKFAALHAAVWSGGTFLYIPKGVKIEKPLQAYFRMNAKGMGQFEHTLIIVEEEADAHYIEGCSAPRYGANSIHAGCVEIYVKPNAKMRYTSIENWSKDTYNLNTKRAIVEKNARIEWLNGNMGSGVTMLYPCSVLKGEGASADSFGVVFAAHGQHQDTGSKVIHAAPNTSSTIVSKSISKDGGVSVYRGLVEILPQASNAKVHVQCDALMIGEDAVSITLPQMQVHNDTATVAHEASTGRISEEQLYYLMSRGLNKERALNMIVSGFVEPILRKLDMEYAVELNKLIELEMEGSIG